MKPLLRRFYRFLVLIAGEAVTDTIVPLAAIGAFGLVAWLVLRLIGFSLHYYFGFEMPVSNGEEWPVVLGLLASMSAFAFGLILRGVWLASEWLADKWREAGKPE